MIFRNYSIVFIAFFIILFGCITINQPSAQPISPPLQTQEGCTYNNPPCQDSYYCMENQCIQKECPHECCDGTDYKVKNCATDYNCERNVCKPIDSDSDGLPDLEEKTIGTNPSISDTDADGLTDYLEVKVKQTNPLNSNTDGDRYSDSQDSDPLKKNSALIKTKLVNTPTRERNTIALATAIGTCIFTACTATAILAVLAPDTWLYKDTWTFEITNEGDDYTSSYQAEFNVYNSNYSTREESLVHLNELKQLHSETVILGRFDSNTKQKKSFTFVTTIGDVPEYLLDAILKKGNFIGVIENEQYEKYQ